MSGFSGMILKPIEKPKVEFEEFMAEVKGVSNVNKIAGTEWFSFTLSLKEPINLEDKPSRSGAYESPFISRWGGESFICTSSVREYSSFLIEKLIPSTGLIFRPQGIDVNGFVKKTTYQPYKYSITSISARISTWGAALRSVSFFGEDVTSSGILIENIEKLNVTSCGVAEASTSREVVRIGSRGSINFSIANIQNYNSIDKILKYLKYHNFYLKD